MFLLLITVSSVGPKVAMSICSQIKPDNLAMAVMNSDINLLTQVKGLGKKTAERIILELRDKLKKITSSAPKKTVTTVPAPGGEVDASMIEDAVSALIVLGYKDSDARDAVNKNGFGDQIKVSRSHRPRRLDHPVIDLFERGFDHSRDVRRGGDYQHDYHCLIAHTRADREFCDGQKRDHKDYERNGSEYIHDKSEYAVEPFDRRDTALRRDVEQDSERKSQNIRARGGDKSHIYRFPDAELQKSRVPEFNRHFRKHCQTSSRNSIPFALSQSVARRYIRSSSGIPRSI